MEELLKDGERIDDLQFKGLRLIQNPSYFCFGIDAVLLSDFANVRKNERAVDLGTGTGIIPLLLYGRYEPKEIFGVEIQSDVADMAERSIRLNDLSERLKIFKGDIKNCFEKLGVNDFDVVVSNPPYKRESTGIKNIDNAKAISRHEILITLREVVFTAKRLLKSGGRFYMIHRPERLKDIVLSLEENRFALRRIRFVHPSLDKAPNMVLIEAVKAGGEFLKVEKPLFVYKDDGSYTDEIYKIYHRDRG